MFVLFFFFSSRRRHTRCSRDWSSDVCSSDLTITAVDRDRKPFFVVSEVLTGKRQATLTLADKANLQVKAERIAQQVANAQVKIEVAADGFITLKSDVVMPIALKPVTVPKVVLVKQFGVL